MKRSAGSEDCRRKVWVIRGIREMLGFKTECGSAAIGVTMLAYDRAIEKIP
jgi:hypothetical protein